MKEYIHYGSDYFTIHRFNKIENSKLFTKPYGGLWAAPVNCDNGWKQYCIDNGYKYVLYKSFKFTLSENANVYHIYSVKDLENLPKIEQDIDNYDFRCMLNFESMVNSGIDAIEVHFSEEVIESTDDYMYNNILYYSTIQVTFQAEQSTQSSFFVLGNPSR